MQAPFVDLLTQTRLLAAEFEAAIGDVVSRCDFVLGAATRHPNVIVNEAERHNTL